MVEAVIWDFGGVLTTSPFEAFGRFERERGLPLFLGYSERLRLDADTAVSATQVIERQLAILDDRLAAEAEPVAEAR